MYTLPAMLVLVTLLCNVRSLNDSTVNTYIGHIVRLGHHHRYSQNVRIIKNTTSSSSPFSTRWGQRPEFLIYRMFCHVHPPGWSSVPAYPFGRHPSISLLVSPLAFFLALSCHQLLSLRFLPFSAGVHTNVVSCLSLSLSRIPTLNMRHREVEMVSDWTGLQGSKV